MHLTVNADKNSRQQEQRSTMVQLVDCKDELNMAMLKVILFLRKKALKTSDCSKNFDNVFNVTEIMMVK